MQYQPKPIDTSNVELPVEISRILETLSQNTHDVWAAERIADGWTFGATHDVQKKTHPSLVPYADLPESEKEYDRNTAGETLRVVLLLGYQISRKT